VEDASALIALSDGCLERFGARNSKPEFQHAFLVILSAAIGVGCMENVQGGEEKV
jgi:hypothetical protein